MRLLIVGFVLCWLLGLVTSVVAAGVTYYVSPTGDESNDGLTPATAKRVIKPLLAALARGDSLVLLEGVYDAANQDGAGNLGLLTVNAADVTVAAAEGASPTLQWALPAMPTQPTFLVVTSGVGGLTIEGLTFRSWWGATHFMRFADIDGLTIQDCVFEGVSPDLDKSVVRVVRGRNVEIARCAFTQRRFGSWYYAVYLEGDQSELPESFRVRDCTFNEEGALADTLGWGAGVTVVDSDDVTIEGCVGYNAGNNRDGDEFFAWDFVDLRNADDVLIRDMHFKRYLFDKTESSNVHISEGISLGDWFGDPCEEVIITECELWGAGHGVDVRDFSHDIAITHVWCDSTYDDCVSITEDCANVDVRYVVSHYSQDNGIASHGRDVTVDHCTIVRPRHPGILLTDGAANTTVRNSIVYDVREPEDWPDAINVVGPFVTGWDFDYDLWFDPDSMQTTFVYSGATHSFIDWQGIGMDVSGAWANPVFLNAGGRAWPIGSLDFSLDVGSPGIGSASDGLDVGAVDSGGLVFVPGASLVSSAEIRVSPNPTRGGVRLHLAAGIDLKSVRIFDAAGRVVAELGGTQRWDGRSRTGRPVPPGVYFLQAQSSKETIRSRLVVAR